MGRVYIRAYGWILEMHSAAFGIDRLRPFYTHPHFGEVWSLQRWKRIQALERIENSLPFNTTITISFIFVQIVEPGVKIAHWLVRSADKVRGA